MIFCLFEQEGLEVTASVRKLKGPKINVYTLKNGKINEWFHPGWTSSQFTFHYQTFIETWILAGCVD